MITCPVCHQPVDPAVMECRTCNIALLSSPTPQFVAAAGTAAPPPSAAGVYPSSPPVAPNFGPPAAPVAEPVVRPEWDRPRAQAASGTSPVVLIAAIVLGALLVAGVGWFALGSGGDADELAGGPGTTLTPIAPDPRPSAGQTRRLDDGWYTYRSPDGAWLVDLPAVPAAPQPLPSNPTVLMAYGVTDNGRIGFGWSGGQVAPGTDERALLIEMMKGIALTRGTTVEPTVLDAPTGPIVTANLQLAGGSALFVLRSIDRRPVVAMVVAGLGEPDGTVATRVLDSFRPAG